MQSWTQKIKTISSGAVEASAAAFSGEDKTENRGVEPSTPVVDVQAWKEGIGSLWDSVRQQTTKEQTGWSSALLQSVKKLQNPAPREEQTAPSADVNNPPEEIKGVVNSNESTSTKNKNRLPSFSPSRAIRRRHSHPSNFHVTIDKDVFIEEAPILSEPPKNNDDPSQVLEVQNRINSLERENEGQNERISSMRKENKELVEEGVKLSKRISQMENYVKKTRGENEETIKKMGNLRVTLNAKEEELGVLKEKTSRLEEQHKNNEGNRVKFETLKQLLEEKDDQMKILAEQATIAADADKMKAENSELEARVKSLKENIESEEASRIQLKDALKHKDEVIATLETKRHGEVDELRQRLDFLSEENDELKVSQAQAITPLIAEINTLQNEILNLRKKDNESEIFEILRKNEDLSAALDQTRQEIESFKTSHKKLKIESEQESKQIVKSLQEVIHQKDQELTEKNTEFSQIRDEQRLSREIIDSLKNEISLLHASKKELVENALKKKEESSVSAPNAPRSGVIVNSTFARNLETRLKKAEGDLEGERANRLTYEKECLSLTEQIANLRLPLTESKEAKKAADNASDDILFLNMKSERDAAIAKAEDLEEILRLHRIFN